MTAVIVGLLAAALLLPFVLFELPYQWARWRRHRSRLRILAFWADKQNAAAVGREVSHPSKEFPYQVRDPNGGVHAGRHRDPVRPERVGVDPPSPPGPPGGRRP